MSAVLIIDDNPEDREWFVDLARKAGASDIQSFADVEEGLAAYRKKPTDLVILDDWLGAKRGWAYGPSFQAINAKATIVIVSGVPFPKVGALSEKLNMAFIVKEDMTESVLRDFLKAQSV